MAQLPPKAPNMAQNWPSFTHYSSMGSFFPSSTAGAPSQQPSCVDEFLDFSSARRGAHRRSASESIAFLETPFVEECRDTNHMVCETNGFDGLDDEQLMSMFSDHIVPSIVSNSNPSTPSDQNSNNDNKSVTLTHHHEQQQQPKAEPAEIVDPDVPQPTGSSSAATNTDSVVDPKRVKRILANRQSAQRSRVRKLQYISELERSVTALQTEVSALSPRVAFLDQQRLILNFDNGALKQRIAALAQDKIFKDAHQEALKNEIERLRQVYEQQNLKMMSKQQPDEEKLESTDDGGPSQLHVTCK